MGTPGGALAGWITRWAAGLRFPQLFRLTVALFVLDLLIPDLLPFADELLLGLLAAWLGTWRRTPGGRHAPGAPVIIDAKAIRESPPADRAP